MRHRKSGLKLNRTSSHRKAMFRNMVTSLIKFDQIRTTDAKAKELRRWGDKIVTLAKRGDLHARRQALAIVRERAVVKKLFDEAPDRFGAVSGGYTRVVKLGRRPGDAAPMSLVSFVTADDAPKKKKKKKTEKIAAAAPTVATTTSAGESSSQQSEEPVVVNNTEVSTSPTDEADANVESASAQSEDSESNQADVDKVSVESEPDDHTADENINDNEAETIKSSNDQGEGDDKPA